MGTDKYFLGDAEEAVRGVGDKYKSEHTDKFAWKKSHLTFNKEQFAAGNSSGNTGDLLSNKIHTFKEAKSFVRRLLKDEREEAKRIVEQTSKAARKQSCENVDRMLRQRPTEGDLVNRNVIPDVVGQAARKKNSEVEIEKMLISRPHPDAPRQRAESAAVLESKLVERPTKTDLEAKNIVVDEESKLRKRKSSIDMLNNLISVKSDAADNNGNNKSSPESPPENQRPTIPKRNYPPPMENIAVWQNAYGKDFKKTVNIQRCARRVETMRVERKKAHIKQLKIRPVGQIKNVGGFPRYPTQSNDSDRKVSEYQRNFVSFGYYPQ